MSAHDLEAKRRARWLERVEIFLHGRQHHGRVGTTLVILRNIHPEYLAISVQQQCDRRRQGFRVITGGPRSNGGIAQAKGIGDDQFRVRQHPCLQAVQVPVRGNFLRPVGTYSNNLHPTPIELSAQFLQSTQLADTVGSPVGSEKLDQHEVPMEAGRIKGFTVAIEGGEVRNRIAHLDALRNIQGLGADIDGIEEKATD